MCHRAVFEFSMTVAEMKMSRGGTHSQGSPPPGESTRQSRESVPEPDYQHMSQCCICTSTWCVLVFVFECVCYGESCQQKSGSQMRELSWKRGEDRLGENIISSLSGWSIAGRTQKYSFFLFFMFIKNTLL